MLSSCIVACGEAKEWRWALRCFHGGSDVAMYGAVMSAFEVAGQWWPGFVSCFDEWHPEKGRIFNGFLLRELLEFHRLIIFHHIFEFFWFQRCAQTLMSSFWGDNALAANNIVLNLGHKARSSAVAEEHVGQLAAAQCDSLQCCHQCLREGRCLGKCHRPVSWVSPRWHTSFETSLLVRKLGLWLLFSQVVIFLHEKGYINFQTRSPTVWYHFCHSVFPQCLSSSFSESLSF